MELFNASERSGVAVVLFNIELVVVMKKQIQVSPASYMSWISTQTNHGFKGSAVKGEYCWGFTKLHSSSGPNRLWLKGLTEYPDQLSCLGLPWTHFGSK